MILRAAALAVIGAAACSGTALAGAGLAPPPEPPGFRGPPYEAALPATLAGARVVSGNEAVALHGAGAAFVDVYPRKTRPAGLPEGTIWREPDHLTIPRAFWLYDTGYERLTIIEEDRLRQGLAAASKGDPDAALVIFCRADCWMSWNAAKRAVALGYRRILWFPEGSDGWEGAGGMLVPAAISGPAPDEAGDEAGVAGD